MKKRFFAIALACVLLIGTAQAAASPFRRQKTYSDTLFTDVAQTDWFAPSVAALYEYALTEGRTANTYDPQGAVTVAEVLTFAARLHAQSTQDEAALSAFADKSGGAWYAPYVSYCASAGIGTEFDGAYARQATRAETIGILAHAMDKQWFDDRNTQLVCAARMTTHYLTDVTDDTPYAAEILWAYGQGILLGADERGTFHPELPVSRAEIAAILTRMIDPSLRLSPDWWHLSYDDAYPLAFGGLVAPPLSVPEVPDADDPEALDALVRAMLAKGESRIVLSLGAVSKKELEQMSSALIGCAKTYCEQMYNSVSSVGYSSGRAEFSFCSSATGENDRQLQSYRRSALSYAVALHRELWNNGTLHEGMTQYEIAKAYYIWLCDHCVYDRKAQNDSFSHLAYGALIDGYAVCDGYVGAYNLLLKLEGISCTALFNDEHIWTVATLDGTEYHIDPTWGDQPDFIDLRCFAMTEQESRMLHPW